MKRIFLFTLIALVLFAIIFFIVTKGGIYNQKVTAVGHSETIKESKERGVFLKELDYKIIPDSIQLVGGKVFFIEKGFRYGKNSTEDTDSLKHTDNYKYQIGVSPAFGDLFVGDYLLGYGDSQFNVMKDTFKRDIVTKIPQYDSIYKVGELLLFDKK